jgi:hypothetical protein
MLRAQEAKPPAPPDPKDATIAALQAKSDFQEKKIAFLLKKLDEELQAHYADMRQMRTQPLALELQELEKQKPVVPADPKAGEKK